MIALTIPPEERPTARELAGDGNVGNACPKCGCLHIEVYRTQKRPTRIVRYRVCRNPSCGCRYTTKQPPEEFLREVSPHSD